MTETELLKGRMEDLANRAYRQNTYTYTNFLSSSDLEVFYELCPKLSFVGYRLFGGYEGSDRLMVGFGSEEVNGYTEEFPIDSIRIMPLIDKFSDELTHRDFLGALMNLGIEREMLGDILIRPSDKSGKRNTAYLFCVSKISDYILENLTKVKHTNVKTQLCTSPDLKDLAPGKETMHIIVASPRIDAVAAGITKLSRSQVVTLFREKKVSLNHRIFENNSYMLKPGDVLSIRGYGKYDFIEVGGETRKGRLSVSLNRYV